MWLLQIAFFYLGIEHRVRFICCECEPAAVTMARAQLWPASPRFPQLAFTFDLLDWAEILLLECQVALSDFVRALYFRCPFLVKKVLYVFLRYKCMLRSVES